jgi:hypothetical protein
MHKFSLSCGDNKRETMGESRTFSIELPRRPHQIVRHALALLVFSIISLLGVLGWIDVAKKLKGIQGQDVFSAMAESVIVAVITFPIFYLTVRIAWRLLQESFLTSIHWDVHSRSVVYHPK